MKISTKEFWQNTFLFSLVLLLAYLFDTSDALAQAAASGTTSGTASGTSGSSGVIAQIGQRAAVAIEYIKPIAYILGGFGLIGLAWGAIFGKLNWKWFGSLAIGLFLVSYMGMAIDFFVGKNHRHFSTATKFQTTGISSRFFEDTIRVRDAAGTSVTQESNSEIRGEEGAEGEGTDGLNPGDEEEEVSQSVLAAMSCEQLREAWSNANSAGNQHTAEVFAQEIANRDCDHQGYTPPSNSDCQTYKFQCDLGDSLACTMLNTLCSGSGDSEHDALCAQLQQACEQGGSATNVACTMYQSTCQNN